VSVVAAHRSARIQHLPVFFLASCAAVGCGVAAWWGVRHPKVGLIVVMAVVGSLPFVIRGLQRRWDPFEPIHLVALGLLVMFVARPILELNEHLQPYAPLYDAAPGFIPAMIVGIVGTATLYAAYFSRLGSRLAGRARSLPTDWDATRSVRYTIWLLIVGALLTSMFVAQVGIHGYIQILSGRSAGNVATFRSSAGYFEAGMYVAIPGCLIALTAWRRQRSLATAFVVLLCLVISLLLTVGRGDRTFEVALILPLVLMYYLHRQRRPRVWAIAVALVAFAIVANVSVTLRNKETRAQHALGPTIVSAITHPGPALASFVRGADGSEFSVLEIEMREYHTGVLHFWPGSTIASLATGWIPHSMYKTKPLSPLQHVTWTLFPATFGGGSFQPPMFGSFYADAGWLTVLLLSAVIGVALRAYWEYLMRHPTNLGVQLFFAASVPLVTILLRADLSLVFAGAVFLSLPLILCITRCSRPPLRLRLGRSRPATVRA
jgi:oligosaccharide repeat unit polymerase